MKSTFALALALLALGFPAAAQTIRTWFASGGGSWQDPANWAGGLLPNSATEAARFTNAAAITVTVDAPGGVTVGGISLGSQSVTLNAGTGGGLTLAGATPWLTNAGQLTVNVPLTSAGFTKQGAGTLSLTADNRTTLAGANLIIAEGQLRGYNSTNATGLELGDASTTITLRTNSQLRFYQVSSGARTYAPTLRLAGSGISGGNPGALNHDSSTTLAAAEIAWAGDLILDGDATIAGQNNGTFRLNRVTGLGQTLTLNVPALTTTITGAVNVTSLVKQGAGTAFFDSGEVLQTGALNVQGGVLALGAGTSLTGVSNLTLNGGATLDLGGSATPNLVLGVGRSFTCPGSLATTLRGGVVVNPGGQFGPGTGTTNYSTVTVTNLVVANGGTLAFDLPPTAAATGDRLATHNLTLSQPTPVVLNFPAGSPEKWAPYTLMTYTGALNGNVTNLTTTPPVGINFATFSSATPGVITVTFSDTTNAPVINLTNGVLTYSALGNATITLGGSCELQLTAASNPLPGSIVNFTSPDAFLVLPNLLPSVVVSSVLSRLRVNGAPAVADSSVRVVQCAMGAMVCAHPAGFQALRVFSGPHFTGASLALNSWTQYKGAALGTLNTNISSFRLKRGYLATFAQNENGSGRSECYVAQDGDLEISLLPATLDKACRFVVVYPWRWTAKKGIAGNIESGLNVRWKYNWNLDQNSTRDLEYVPIRQTRWWPGLGENWQTRGASHLLGYNEPDKSDQANIAVGDAIWSWPDLLAPGLRVGAPAVSDGGRDGWLYPFLDQADAAGLRVDFVPVHYYWCRNPSDAAGAASQMYDFLKATYDRVKRPLWITEWNNGANWTGCGDPSFAQQQAAVAAMIEMLDNTPFVERYALYNWVEDVRRLKWDDGSLTAAGTTYRDKASPVGHVQAMPGNGLRSLAQLRFETNTLDTAGYGNNGVTTGSPAYTNGLRGQALVFDGVNTVVTLPTTVARGSGFTFAAWLRWGGGANWQRIFDFGNSTTHYLFLTPSSGSGTLRFAIKNGGAEQIVETSALASNQWRHVAVTLSGSTARLYVNGVQAAVNTGLTITPASFSPRINRLGKSHFSADPLFRGAMDEVLLTDYALSAAQVAALLANTPPAFTNGSLARGPVFVGQSPGLTLAGTATDADANDSLTFNKVAGPAWLTVAANGALGGTPAASDLGTNTFTVRVTDAAGLSGFAVLTLSVLQPPPVLPVQAPRTLYEQTLLRVTNTASSGVAPLTYTLLNPPTGASITAAGLILWAPTETQGPGSYSLTTMVTDGQTPAQRATNSFAVTVLESNLPPTLPPLADVVLNVGQWLRLTNTATDPDWPPNTLTYALDTGPGDAALDPVTGVLTWRPPVSAAGTSNAFTLRVTDDGVPSLSAMQSFAVLVNSLTPVTLAPATFSATGIQFLLSGEPGPDYTIETALALAPDAGWSAVLTTNLVTSPLAVEVPRPADGSPQRFYRVRIGP